MTQSAISETHRLAHELRSPLSAIRLNLQRVVRLLEADGPAGPQPSAARPDSQALLDVCIAELQRLEDRTRRLVSFDPAANPCASHSFDPAPALRHIVELCRARLESAGAELSLGEIRPGVRVTGCHHEYVSAVIVLIDNARDALDGRGGRVRVVTEWISDPQTGEPVWFDTWVCDDGPGVPPLLRTRIFAPRFSTRLEGAGIGLRDARDIAESLGGSLELRSGRRVCGELAGAGAAFRFRMPVRPPVRSHPVAYVPGPQDRRAMLSMRTGV